MTSAVIVSTARTPLAKSWKGAFNMTHGATLGGHAVKAAVERAGIDPAEVDDVIMGCATPEGATGSNIARQIALRAGLPVTTSGMTVNRFCSSGLQTIAMAAQRVIAGENDVVVAGGVESISCVQNEANKHMLADPWLVEHKPEIYWNMLQTAEQVAKRYKIERERMDRYGAESQQKATAARDAGDTLGGVTAVRASNVIAGLGSYAQWDRRLDGRIAQALASIQSAKGVEFADAFDAAGDHGSRVHDPIERRGSGFGRPRNRAGGLEGGVTNGEDVVVRVAFKPISTLMKPLPSVDLRTGDAAPAHVERSDVCVIPAAGVVAESMLALVLADAVCAKFGEDSIDDITSAIARYRERLKPIADR